MAAEVMTEATVDQEALDAFVAGVRGDVFRPGDEGYDEARAIWNGLIDRRPALIVRCTGAADVVDAVNFAREHDLLLSVKGGGHNVAGNAVNDGGLVVDLSGMNGVHVDPSTGIVRAEGGATWGDCDRESQLFGLAVPGGVVSTTGIAGLTLHGGLGHMRRKYGLSIDSLLSVDIVTADGQLRRASATENEDLFWAVRGAGSNFGVVTSFEFQAYPLGPMVAVAAVFYPLEQGKAILTAWRDHMASAPDEVSSLAICVSVPAGGAVSAASCTGAPVVIVVGVYSGSVEDGEPVVQPLRELGEPLLDLSGPWPWLGAPERVRRALPQGRPLLLEVARAGRAVRGRDRRHPRVRRPPADADDRHRGLAPRRRDDARRRLGDRIRRSRRGLPRDRGGELDRPGAERRGDRLRPRGVGRARSPLDRRCSTSTSPVSARRKRSSSGPATGRTTTGWRSSRRSTTRRTCSG